MYLTKPSCLQLKLPKPLKPQNTVWPPKLLIPWAISTLSKWSNSSIPFSDFSLQKIKVRSIKHKKALFDGKTATWSKKTQNKNSKTAKRNKCFVTNITKLNKLLTIRHRGNKNKKKHQNPPKAKIRAQGQKPEKTRIL